MEQRKLKLVNITYKNGFATCFVSFKDTYNIVVVDINKKDMFSSIEEDVECRDEILNVVFNTLIMLSPKQDTKLKIDNIEVTF